ncbi:Pre-mRNA-processing ATP-dependent RNA helicase PRP5 [Labeo rohita]|uniref:Pre-mRNA-processing ATP-dependent RNA helicase PRP5 n=1 Tax=Labeo rohita TaxID=84645 RepID=A0ABQ8L1J4_LABRO|nr:Pre-mRNA-processing ATP-dependent RNA helicase PRP5 [Labeo rohita]
MAAALPKRHLVAHRPRPLMLERPGLLVLTRGSLSAGTSDEGQSETGAEVEAVLPPFDPFSPLSFGSKEEGRLKVRLARLQFEAQERAQARQAEMDLRLEIRRLEIEEKEVKLRQLELDTLKLTPTAAVQPARADASFVAPVVDPSSTTFDVSKHIAFRRR